MRKIFLISALLLIPIFGFLFWHFSSPETLSSLTDNYAKLGEVVSQDLEMLPTVTLAEEAEAYSITDAYTDGIDIQFAGKEKESVSQGSLNLTFPKDYSKPIEVKLDDQRIIPITDLSGKNGYETDVLTRDGALRENQGFLARLFPEEGSPNYLRYTSEDNRKSLLYAYQRDQALGTKKLKHWTIYEEGSGLEKEEYQIDQAKVGINERGEAEVFYFGQQQIQNEQVKAEVEPSLLERAERTLAKEMGEDILSTGSPDFVIPKPYYIDNKGEKHDAEWKWSEDSKTLSASFSPEHYPVALDPTLQFTVPGVSNSGSVITGETASDFGVSFAAGDFNADGKTDLAVGANNYSSNDTGRVYIFHNDGDYTTAATSADVIISHSSGNTFFGSSLIAGDFNSDGRVDLAGSAPSQTTNTGQVYIFHNDGSFPTTTATADVTITGETTSNYFGASLAAGDLNSDGKTDLIVGAHGYSTSTGRAYIFYNGSIVTESAGNADVILTGGTTSDEFGSTLATGDLNADGKIDLAVGANGYSTNTGRAYIFYNGSIITEDAGGADVTITGGSGGDDFGSALATGDLNADGRIDLVVGAYHYSTNVGRAYIYNNDGSIPTTAATADVIITGEGSNEFFGYEIATGDMNNDGRTDLIVGAYRYSSYAGRSYIFYNDGSIPTAAGTADVIISGESSSYFGKTFAIGDFNTDGRIDLVVGANNYSSSAGRFYIFYSQNGQVNVNKSITGETTSDFFGIAATAGDFNADGETDLAVGAKGYSTSAGRVYIFHNDGQYPTTAASADITITGEASSQFGSSLVAGDFNADGETDLAVGAITYSTNTGRVYIFHNDGSIPTTAGTADITLTGGATGNYFGTSLTAGDFNADGEVDIAIGAPFYSSQTGRAYIFYNGSIITEDTTGADVTITGGATSNNFGNYLGAGDFNGDGATDLLVSAPAYSSSTGRVYIFHNDGSIPTTAGTADVTITGDAASQFGSSLAVGDFDASGTTDFAVGAQEYDVSVGGEEGRAYIFYNDGSIPTTAATADVTLDGSGETVDDQFGYQMISGDFNADGRTDLVVTAPTDYDDGRAYFFYNDGAYPSGALTADVAIHGDSGMLSGRGIAAGDFNADGRTDLVVGEPEGGASGEGSIQFYETRENFAWTVQRVNAPRVNTNATGEEFAITGEASSAFGVSFGTGDFNSDGKADLVVSATTYLSSTGRVYIFYSDGSLAANVTSADLVITGGATSDSFGEAFAVGDFNADGRTDLVVTADGYGSSDGRAYVFYNDGSMPMTAATADVTIDGENNSTFGDSAAAGDFNADGRTDFAVGGDYYSATFTGRVYVFYNDGTYPTTAATADAIMTGEGTNDSFGKTLTAGDLNSDGKTDLIVGAWAQASAYIFYGGSITTENASAADVIITSGGADYFSWSLVTGDFNADGRTDLAIGNTEDSGTEAGDVYLFYNDGTMPTTMGTADVSITAQGNGNLFGYALAAGDFNADGRTDLAVGARGYSSDRGRSYIFYNDGSYPSAAASADVILDGEAASDGFGRSLASLDINADGRTDLVVGASAYSSSRGRVYVYTLNDTVTTGGATSNYFGAALSMGDFNADGRIDLAVGALGYSSNTGRVYLFYNDGSISAAVANADVTITGETASDQFGRALVAGDFNADGETDLAVGASEYSSATGRVYIFYNDGSYPSGAGSANVTLAGNGGISYGRFGWSLTAGDLDTDGDMDLAVGTDSAGGYIDRVYIFHNDGSYPAGATTADVTLTGVSQTNFGTTMATGDFNADGRTDIVVGGTYSGGGAYIFYNDGSMPTSAASADVTITGEAGNVYFTSALTAGDFNADGRTDLVIGSYGYSTNTGRAYIFYNDGSIPTTAATADVTITGESQNGYFGVSLKAGDFNADGRDDLVVSAHQYSVEIGKVYYFYNDGSYPSLAASADMSIVGDTNFMDFGGSLAVGDLNVDGKSDLIVGATGYSTDTGRVYIFITEIANASATYRSPSTNYTGELNVKGTGKLKGSAKIK